MSLFGSFTQTIEHLPPQAILAVLVRQGKMIEDDLSRQRPSPAEDTQSIFNFCRFVDAAQNDKPVSICFASEDEIKFYRRIIAKLVVGGVLPAEAIQRFDETFLLPGAVLDSRRGTLAS